MTKQALLVGAALILPFSGETLIAADYTVEISGAEGAVGGTCLLVTANQNAQRDVSGTVPLKFELSADVISCAVQRKAGSGYLHIAIRNPGGHVVAESSQLQPFGVVMAAGR